MKWNGSSWITATTKETVVPLRIDDVERCVVFLVKHHSRWCPEDEINEYYVPFDDF